MRYNIQSLVAVTCFSRLKYKVIRAHIPLAAKCDDALAKSQHVGSHWTSLMFGRAGPSDCQLLDYCIAMAADLAPREPNEEIMYSKRSSTGERTN